MPVFTLPRRALSSRVAGVALMSPLLVVGVWGLWKVLLFSWDFAFWVPASMYRLWLQFECVTRLGWSGVVQPRAAVRPAIDVERDTSPSIMNLRSSIRVPRSEATARIELCL